ncbi:hypothetical protein L7F22_001157 [Adiantum nelumboides]|nr:hypothetical protein [Adiantum nelumboides]
MRTRKNREQKALTEELKQTKDRLEKLESQSSPRQLVEYVVLDVESAEHASAPNRDHALGYDLYGANVNDFELDKYKSLVLPEVVLVKKSYEEKRHKKRGKPRPWKLRNLPMEVDANGKGRVDEDKKANDYEKFMDELEEDPDLRASVAVYRNADYRDQSEMGSLTDGEEPPSIPLEELLADLHLEEGAASASEDEDEHMDDL